MMSINEYIYFEYYKWKVPTTRGTGWIDLNEEKDYKNLKYLYEYNIEVFKVWLFIMWDIMEYLDLDVKNSIRVDISDQYLYI